jgi:hypothetical protein
VHGWVKGETCPDYDLQLISIRKAELGIEVHGKIQGVGEQSENMGIRWKAGSEVDGEVRSENARI